jgi:hypothetical protein
MSTQRPRLKEEPVASATAHEVTVGSKVCTIGKFSAIEGWKLIHKLTKVAGPMIGAFSKGDFSQGISDMFNELTDEDMIRLIKQMTSVCLIDGRKITDADLGDYATIFELCGEVVKHNFGDFFSQVMDGMVAIGQNKTGPT